MISKKQMEILKALSRGRKLKQRGWQRFWEDGKKSPSLADTVVAPLFQKGLLMDEQIDRQKPAFWDNLSGYIVLSEMAEAIVNDKTLQLRKNAQLDISGQENER